MAERFRGEPHIICLLDAFGTGPKDTAHLVYSHAGQDLHGLLKAQALTGDQVRPVALHVFRGLAVMHEAGFIHTDIKPQNIIVQITDGVWHGRLADLGSAVEALYRVVIGFAGRGGGVACDPGASSAQAAR